jgi:hypothetical protein
MPLHTKQSTLPFYRRPAVCMAAKEARMQREAMEVDSLARGDPSRHGGGNHPVARGMWHHG